MSKVPSIHAKKCIPKRAEEILAKLKKTILRRQFVLAGGTGLAIQLGHRYSKDLDFFSERSFSPDTLLNEIKRLGRSRPVQKLDVVLQQLSEGTLTITMGGTKVSFFHYLYSFSDKMAEFGGIPVAGILDIASMKISAICQRGVKRDFVDLYFILQKVPFKIVSESIVRHFGKGKLNPLIVCKALVYFNDAESHPEPVYKGHQRPNWKTVKKFFIDHIKKFALDLERENI